MIKNILYSIFLHLLLLIMIYYSFIRESNDKIEDGDEIMVSIVNDNYKNHLPFNEKSDNNPKNEPPKEQIQKDEIIKKIDNKPLKDNNKIIEKTVKTDNYKADSLKEKQQSKNPENQKPSNEIKPNEINPPKKIEEKIEEKINEEKPPLKKFDETSNNQNNSGHKILKLKPNPIPQEEDLSSGLSSRETINIKSQLKLCFKRATDESGFNNKHDIIITIKINQLGYINTNMDEVIDNDKYYDTNSTDYKIAIDNIKRALNLCSPLRNLPIEKYESWKEIVIQFDASNNLK